MNEPEYLLSYGVRGDFGRFRSARPLECRRGDRAVVRSPRGLELAQVLRPAQPGHAHFLPNTSVGRLLRLADAADERAAAEMAGRAGALFERGRGLLVELALPLELIDVEVLLDGEQAVLHHLRWADADLRPFVSALSKAFGLQIVLQDLTHSAAAEQDEPEHGCGRAGCGSGGCGSGGCGSGGCGSCGSAEPQEVKAYFAGLREQMERRRTPLL
jgi:hypothetical protein